METQLAQKHCVPCEGGVPRVQGETAERLLAELDHWRLAADDHHLERVFVFPDFSRALDFVNRIGEVAEEEGHHPDIRLSYGRVGLELFTHAIDGLSENDFILAAKIDALPRLRFESKPS